MSLNPLFVTAPSLQEYFVDKDSGLPLAGGKVYFYHDSGNRDIPKPVFELQGNSANYTYVPLPNPVILSAVGTIQDDNGNDVIPYYYPFDVDGNPDLYYIVVQSSGGVPQFTRSAWPNPESGTSPSSSNTIFNYVPNGQFLNHTNLPDNTNPPYLLQPGTNVLAQGGWTFELTNPPPSGSPSVNTAQFIPGFTLGFPETPRNVLNLICTAVNPLDTQKILRLKFYDVNKFSSDNPDQTFTFAFAGTSVSTLPCSLFIHKFFGTEGSPAEDIPVATFTVDTIDTTLAYQFQINFGNNDGTFVDRVANNDFVSLDIYLPLNISFNANFVDFVLATSTGEVIASYPIETNADMMTRSVMGWATTVDPTGMDLFLPPILTQQGMIWDSSQIGQIGQMPLPILSPMDSSIPQHNMMPCDGATYITTDYAANGIPFQRLFNYLFNTPYTNMIPLYGTGNNYDTAVFPSGYDNILRITWNTAGAGSPQAIDGAEPTGFAFAPIYTYNGSTTGIDSLGLFSSNISANTVLLTTIADGGQFTNPNFNNTGFTGSDQSDFMQGFVENINGLLAFQKSAWFITTVSGAALIIAGAGRYMTLWSAGNTQQYYIWFNVDGANTDPGGPGDGIQVNVGSLYTAQDVADCLREVINGLQSTNITITAAPSEGSYLYFSSNPSALRNFYIWYSYVADSIPPSVADRIGIKVLLPATPSTNIVRNLTVIAINSYQFQAPDFQGMFFRAVDPNGTWDIDNINRWSYTSGISGANAGTFEYGQFLSHYHSELLRTGGGTDGGWYEGSLLPGSARATFTAGGNETRPVNTYIYPFIRY